jgi:hypothetical protein
MWWWGDDLKKTEDIVFIDKLLDFLQAGFQDPIQIISYLQLRNKCNPPNCLTKCCKPLIPYFSGKKGNKLWSLELLNKFDKCRRQWYVPRQNKYEEPLNAFFTLPRIAQFLQEEVKLSSSEISEIFIMEFKGGGEKESFVPNCLWKMKKKNWVAITKDFKGGKRMCCDFYFKNYMKNNKNIPNIVGEIKIAIPNQRQNVWNKYKEDIEKCREWLKPDTTPYLVERFNMIKFDYALAILIDLTGGETYSNLWNSEMKQMEAKYLKEHVFVRFIQPK